MITRNALGAIALATAWLAPQIGFAQDAPAPGLYFGGAPAHGEIEIDVGGLMGNNPNQAGRYTGFNTDGVNAGIGSIELNVGGPWDSGDTRFFEMNGRNLIYQFGTHLGTGLGNDSNWSDNTSNGVANNGSLEFRAGNQGVWEAGVFYDTITYTGNVIDSLYSVDGSVATLNRGLTPWGGASATSAKGAITGYTVPSLNATGAMLPFQTGTRRDTIGGNFKFILDNWTFTGAISHEHKEGSLEQSFDGPWGGTAFSQPVNYDTDRYDMSAAYTTHHLQGLLQYTFSHFNDNVNFVNLPYPTANTSAPFQRSAAYSTPPSNDAHYLTMMLATDVVPMTHINANARVGLEIQNNTVGPNTADPNPPASAIGPGLLNPSLQGTSTTSPNMMAEIYQLKLSAASHPLTDLNTRIYYGLDGRSVSLNQFAVNTGGTGGASDSSLFGLAYVVPQDWLKQNVGGEVAYRFLPEYNSKVIINYRFDDISRSNAQVGRSSTNTASIALLSEFGPEFNGKLSFEYADRTGTLSYITPWLNLTGTPSPTYSGAYYQAPMTSEAVVLRADYSPMESLSTSLYVKFKNENYTYPAASLAGTAPGTVLPLSGIGTGVRQDYALSIGPDINWRPTHELNIHVFYTYEQLYFNNLGNGQCSVAPITALCTGTAGYFRNQDTSSTQTIGLSGDWQVNEKLKLQAEYTVSFGSVMFGQFDGVFVPNPTQSYQNVTNYPDINSLMNNISVTATYQLMPNVTLIMRGIYTAFHNNDWNDTANAVQGAGTTAISFLTPGYPSPNYSVGALIGGIKVRF